jgi:trehalose 6-phosphate phosphatase
MDAIWANAHIALFLDLDGTLIDIAPTPSSVTAPPGLSDLIALLTAILDGAVAVLSGRSLAAIDRLLYPLQPLAAGANGSEIRDAPGGKARLAAPLLPESFVEAVEGLASLDPGIAIEHKGAAIAVHYRLAVGAGPELLRRLRALLESSALPLEVRAGKMVFEVVNKNVSKGAALTEFMRGGPFLGRRPIMIGDDAVDIDAFAAAESVGGQGLRVAGEFFAGADADFEGTAAVRNWLTGLATRMAAKRSADDR